MSELLARVTLSYYIRVNSVACNEGAKLIENRHHRIAYAKLYAEYAAVDTTRSHTALKALADWWHDTIKPTLISS